MLILSLVLYLRKHAIPATPFYATMNPDKQKNESLPPPQPNVTNPACTQTQRRLDLQYRVGRCTKTVKIVFNITDPARSTGTDYHNNTSQANWSNQKLQHCRKIGVKIQDSYRSSHLSFQVGLRHCAWPSNVFVLVGRWVQAKTYTEGVFQRKNYECDDGTPLSNINRGETGVRVRYMVVTCLYRPRCCSKGYTNTRFGWEHRVRSERNGSFHHTAGASLPGF